MESLILSFNAVAPVFLLMAVGYTVKGLGVVDKSTFNAINKLVFKLFLPVLLFYNVYTTDSIETLDAKLILFTVLGVFAVFIIGYFIVLRISDNNKKRGVILQSFFRSNFAILGIPLINSICKDNVTGLTYLMVAVVVPLFNVLAVVCFELFKKENKGIDIKALLKGVVTNPLIIGCVIGVIFYLFNIPLPYVVEKAVSDISKVATPLAIIVLGGSFTFLSMKGYVKELLISVSSRLLIVPLLVLSLAVAMGFRGEALACLLIVFGAPVAVSSFSMAQQMGGDEELSAQVIVVSSVMCIFTLFLWIFVINSLGLF